MISDATQAAVSRRFAVLFEGWAERVIARRGRAPTADELEHLSTHCAERIAALEGTYGPRLHAADSDSAALEIVEQWFDAATAELRRAGLNA